MLVHSTKLCQKCWPHLENCRSYFILLNWFEVISNKSSRCLDWVNNSSNLLPMGMFFFFYLKYVCLCSICLDNGEFSVLYWLFIVVRDTAAVLVNRFNTLLLSPSWRRSLHFFCTFDITVCEKYFRLIVIKCSNEINILIFKNS